MFFSAYWAMASPWDKKREGGRERGREGGRREGWREGGKGKVSRGRYTVKMRMLSFI